MQERITQPEVGVKGIGAAVAAYKDRSFPVQQLFGRYECSQHSLYKTLRERQITLRSEEDGRPRCVHCGDPYTPHLKTPGQTVCSRDCYHEMKRAQARLNGSIIECRCGFEVHYKKAIDARFCSERCKTEALAEELRAIAKRAARHMASGLSFAEAIRAIGTTEYLGKRACKNYCACGTRFIKGGGCKTCPTCSGRRAA